jgi:hypothetical protein
MHGSGGRSGARASQVRACEALLAEGLRVVRTDDKGQVLACIDPNRGPWLIWNEPETEQ